MNADDMFPSRTMKTSDLKGHAVTLTIKGVVMEELGSGDDSETKPVMYFEGKTKGMVVNITKKNALKRLFGGETEGWIGQEIEIFPSTTDYKGKEVDCINIKTDVAPPTPADSDDIPF